MPNPAYVHRVTPKTGVRVSPQRRLLSLVPRLQATPMLYSSWCLAVPMSRSASQIRQAITTLVLPTQVPTLRLVLMSMSGLLQILQGLQWVEYSHDYTERRLFQSVSARFLSDYIAEYCGLQIQRPHFLPIFTGGSEVVERENREFIRS